ncbi:ABC transporter permease [Clostridium luticellarii]|jgi:putative ABC transport system permease protein|uniref:Putative ABC transporter permease YknZ n=1 Tax=Clostridium luticellarii TaxID=1691940 RepID=A0A2T0B5P6_9CLOT|nr:ABC transporter permease [Clostridium luticellarii]MCI1969465.1 ABC transporter permease [Clostridium luticellarii]MCI1996781.1 ABC transporter permease [Clostridium luticellarii]MCI2039632.1 ABC transporter permease [Clostridium luticellarii]PRR79117.1 putative ABC transporter permease YknZ [Clostridium luticellarii]
MNLWELVCSAILSLRTHKLRVFLTMIGIIIGISSVVVILSVGEGLKAQVNQSTEDTGANTFTVNFEPSDLDSTTAAAAFSYRDFQDLKNIDGVDQVSKSSNGLEGLTGVIENAAFFNKQTYLTVNGYDKNPGIISGRSITKEDNDFKHYVVILTKDHAKALFGDNVNEGIGKGIKIKDEYFEVVGIGNGGSGLLSMEYDYVPKFAKDLLENDTEISSIDVKAKQGFNSDSVFKKVKKELGILHPDVKGSYTKGDPKAVSKAFEKIISGITTFIAVVSGISLFVGGIGVMNIMYVSVTERRREIGIRRAIGAKPASILWQFLIESIFITGMGGILGISAGYLLSLILGNFLPFKPLITIGILIGSSSTSIIVGIIFGIIPAYKAAKLDPIKAIYR